MRTYLYNESVVGSFHEENYEDTDIHDETIELETVLAGLLDEACKGELLKTALCTETCLTQRL